MGWLNAWDVNPELLCKFERSHISHPESWPILLWRCISWKVAHFQREVVRLQFKKVLLQKSLRDEHDKVPIYVSIVLETFQGNIDLYNCTQCTTLIFSFGEKGISVIYIAYISHKPVRESSNHCFLSISYGFNRLFQQPLGQGGAGPWCASRRGTKSQEQRESSGDLECVFFEEWDVWWFCSSLWSMMFLYIHEGCSWKGCVFQGVVIEDSKNLCVLDSRISSTTTHDFENVRILGDRRPHFKTITRQTSIGHIADQLVTHLTKTVLDCALGPFAV